MPNQTYQYSNGLNLEKVIPAFEDRLRWKSDGASLSGRYFDDGSFHTLVDENVFLNSQGDAEISDNDFDAKKIEFANSALLRSINSVFDNEDVIEQSMLYEIMELKNKVPELPSADFVGQMIDLSADNTITLQVLKAVLHFDLDSTFKLYAYCSGESVPYWEQTVIVKGGKHSIINLVDCFLSYDEHKSTSFFVGYKPSEVTGGAKPYIHNYSFRTNTCVYDARTVTADLPIVDGTIRYPSGTLGLNLEIKSFHDRTSQIISSQSSFDELIGLVHASMVLEQILFSQRKNAEQRTALDNADRFALQLDLTGALPISDSPHISSLRGRIEKQVNKIKSSFQRKKTGVISYASY